MTAREAVFLCLGLLVPSTIGLILPGLLRRLDVPIRWLPAFRQLPKPGDPTSPYRRVHRWRRYRCRQLPDADPPQAYKWATICRSPDGAVVFMPLQMDELRLAYGAEAMAQCPYRNTSPPPHPEHKCGFYALKRPQDLGRVPGMQKERWSHQLYSAIVVLEVELSGGVIAGELGYRAQHQRVMRVRFRSRCIFCFFYPRRATGFIWWHRSEYSGRATLVPACRRHADPTLTPAAVAGLLGTEVAFGR